MYIFVHFAAPKNNWHGILGNWHRYFKPFSKFSRDERFPNPRNEVFAIFGFVFGPIPSSRVSGQQLSLHRLANETKETTRREMGMGMGTRKKHTYVHTYINEKGRRKARGGGEMLPNMAKAKNCNGQRTQNWLYQSRRQNQREVERVMTRERRKMENGER